MPTRKDNCRPFAAIQTFVIMTLTLIIDKTKSTEKMHIEICKWASRETPIMAAWSTRWKVNCRATVDKLLIYKMTIGVTLATKIKWTMITMPCFQTLKCVTMLKMLYPSPLPKWRHTNTKHQWIIRNIRTNSSAINVLTSHRLLPRQFLPNLNSRTKFKITLRLCFNTKIDCKKLFRKGSILRCTSRS